uniref:Uncharacterized protein n=1 Tax=Heterorhabditis bacteriophora TaxID=37862 RepID=A0A1I7WIA8_HETBA
MNVLYTAMQSIDISLIFTDTLTEIIIKHIHRILAFLGSKLFIRTLFSNSLLGIQWGGVIHSLYSIIIFILLKNYKIILIICKHLILNKYIESGLLKLLQSVNTVCTSKIRYIICRINPFHIHG